MKSIITEDIKIDDYVFLKKWKKTTCKMIMKSYPDIPKKDIMTFLDKQIRENLKNPECYIDNDYLGKTIKSTLLEIYNWICKTKPICAGYGVFYRNQHQIMSLLSKVILKFLSRRKFFKDKLQFLDQDSYEYAANDRYQASEKVNCNSLYGCLGNIISFLFNKYTAPSVTGTGQSLISATFAGFESFLVNNIKFNNINECMTYLYNIGKEKYTHDMGILLDIDIDDVENRIISMFYRYNDKYYDAIHSYLESLSQDELNKIYYKNNLYEFSRLTPIKTILSNIFIKCDRFMNPNKLPKEITHELETLYEYYQEFVVYNHFPMDKIQRLKNDRRKTVVTVDTDSNIVNVHPWVEFIFNEIIPVSPGAELKSKNDLRYISINTMAYILTCMMRYTLGRYTANANVPEDFRHYINIKNEFLFTRMILASKKKRYMSSIKLREGKEFNPEKIDIKGFDFMKSTTSSVVKKTYQSIITKRVLHAENIDLKGVLRDIGEFENAIVESLKNGEKDFLSPLSVKELEAYADPFKGQGVRAVHAWNSIYPEMTIELPAKVDIVKLTLDNDDNLAKLSKDYPDIHERVIDNIVNSTNEKIAKKGLIVLAIPKNVSSIPDWAIPYIDYDTTSYNVLKKVFPVLESLGFKTLKTSKREYFSNILNI